MLLTIWLKNKKDHICVCIWAHASLLSYLNTECFWKDYTVKCFWKDYTVKY